MAENKALGTRHERAKEAGLTDTQPVGCGSCLDVLPGDTAPFPSEVRDA